MEPRENPKEPGQSNEETSEDEDSKDSSPKKSDLPSYLANNSWETELNFKLWVTKGARFVAAKRCEHQAKLSHFALTLLSVYLIIIGITPFFLKAVAATIEPDLLALGTTATSILLLALGLIETSRNYPMQSHQFHECGLKISRLYNALRRAKEISAEKDKHQEIERITDQYNEILETFKNHEPIDYALFQNQKPEYFKRSKFQCFQSRLIYFWLVPLRYYLIMIAPLFLVALMFVLKP